MLASGLEALASKAGQGFSLAGQAFSAWPVQAPVVTAGRVDASPDHLFFFESIAATTPPFKAGAILVGDDGKSYTVSRRDPINPTTGVLRFAVHPGRA